MGAAVRQYTAISPMQELRRGNECLAVGLCNPRPASDLFPPFLSVLPKCTLALFSSDFVGSLLFSLHSKCVFSSPLLKTRGLSSLPTSISSISIFILSV